MSHLPPPGPPLDYQGALPVFPPRRPTVVTVIAILVIVMSSLTLCCTPFSILPLLFDFGQGSDPAYGAIYQSRGVLVGTVVMSVIGIVLALVNLIAAIQALNLKTWSRRALIRIAILQLVMVVVGIAFTIVVVVPAVSSLSTNDPAVRVGAVAGAVGGIFGGLINAVLPSLTIYFFRQPAIAAAFAPPTYPAGGYAASGPN